MKHRSQVLGQVYQITREILNQRRIKYMGRTGTTVAIIRLINKNTPFAERCNRLAIETNDKVFVFTFSELLIK